MRLFTSLLSFCLLIVLFSACQEEDQAIRPTDGFNPKPIDIPGKGSPQMPENSSSQDWIFPLNDHVSYRFPRFPRPLPCDERAKCQFILPQFIISVGEGNIIKKIEADLYTEQGELYASSRAGEKNMVSYDGDEAYISLTPMNGPVETNRLILVTKVTYVADGKEYTEELVDESFPLSTDPYYNHGSVSFIFPFPVFPRPLPCIPSKEFKCQIDMAKLHVMTEGYSVREIQAMLYNAEGKLYATSIAEAGGYIDYRGGEALAGLTIVNQEIAPENLILDLQIDYEIDGEIISEEIYEEGISLM